MRQFFGNADAERHYQQVGHELALDGHADFFAMRHAAERFAPGSSTTNSSPPYLASIPRFQALLNGTGRSFQHLVAHGVPMPVVDQLEKIQVKKTWTPARATDASVQSSARHGQLDTTG